MNINNFSFFGFIFLFFCSQVSFAAVTLSINPVDGSNTLRFKEADGFSDRKEIRIRVSSTDGKRYQVFQRLMEPLVNERGESLDVRAVQTATIGNSNGSGTLYMQNLDRLSMGEQLLYTSGQGGVSDSFVVAYGIDSSVFNASGNFSGRLVFTARAMGEASQDQSFVTFLVESRPSNLKTTVFGGRTKSHVHVKDTDVSPENADFARISFTGNGSGDVRVYQEADSFPQSSAGEELGTNVLGFAVGGGSDQGVRVTDATPLSRTRTLLYSGRGDASDIEVRFFVNPDQVAFQNAGLYTGKLKYVVETTKGRQEYLLDLECEVKPVFTIDVTLPPEGVNFNHVLPNAPAMDKEIEVAVRSNLHRPYQVLQNLQSSMTNEKGEEIRKEYFTVKVDIDAPTKGRTRFGDFQPMQTGECVVFSSDSQGSPATFKVTYRLQGYPQMSGGNFAAPIRFSLDQN